MDLHDYRDVAENYDRYLEVMYEHEDHHENFQEFYLNLARQYGAGGVVDVACGTGAVLLYLAQRGIEIDGTDLSGEMCRVAAGKAEALGLRLNIMPADMTAFSSGRKYSLAISIVERSSASDSDSFFGGGKKPHRHILFCFSFSLICLDGSKIAE